MGTARMAYRFPAALLAGLSLLMSVPASADTLAFRNTPAANAVAQMNRKLGVTIVFRGAVSASTPVTFSVDDPNTPDGRLQAVNSLATALGLDFQKVFVVSKIDPGAAVPAVKMDTNAPIVFPSEKMSAREAIQTVASVDSAMTQISGAITGDVVFPSRQMRAVDAAALIAKQTQTGWKAYYGLFRRGEGPPRLEGMVLDYTNGGQPITVLPTVTYRNVISTPAPVTTVPNTTPDPNAPTDPTVAVVPAEVPNAYAPAVSPYGYSPFGYSPYGYGGYGPTPYDYGGYGYGGYGGAFGFPDGAVYPGYDYTPGGSGPVGTGIGPTVTSVPNTNGAAVLPDFPYAGGVGGQMIGGY